MTLPSQPKNQQTRRRGDTLGEAGADWPMGFAAKPMLDEHRNSKPPTGKDTPPPAESEKSK
jgi:hypothetical protein